MAPDLIANAGLNLTYSDICKEYAYLLIDLRDLSIIFILYFTGDLAFSLQLQKSDMWVKHNLSRSILNKTFSLICIMMIFSWSVFMTPLIPLKSLNLVPKKCDSKNLIKITNVYNLFQDPENVVPCWSWLEGFQGIYFTLNSNM